MGGGKGTETVHIQSTKYHKNTFDLKFTTNEAVTFRLNINW